MPSAVKNMAHRLHIANRSPRRQISDCTGMVLAMNCARTCLNWYAWLVSVIVLTYSEYSQSSCLQNFPQFARLLAAFAGVAIPAALVNSGLKYMQKRIQIAFQRRLTHHLHQQYCSNRAYYAASTLGGLTNADQRITEDVEKFAYNISELYSYTFKVTDCRAGIMVMP